MDIYKEVTDRIIAQMEQGIIPWQKPWAITSTSAAVSHVTGKPYSLLNQMMLNKAGEYVTFNQCKQEGGRVKKGEKASMVVFWKWIEQEDKDTGEKKSIPLLRYYNVFHISQCEGLKEKHAQKKSESTVSADENAESIIENYVKRSGVKINNCESDNAYYQPTTDSITLPLMEQFNHVAEYYSTTFHEMIHSTGHESRLNRLERTAFFGNESYSKEELIAEIGAATLVHHAGLETSESFRNSAAYIQSWLRVLKNDKRFIVSASGKAEKAVNLILGEENISEVA
jgi:antirestriction protein ArdC